MVFTASLRLFASTCTEFAATISRGLGFGQLKGRTVGDWRFATELKRDMLNLSKQAKHTQPELAKKIESLAQKIIAEKENDLPAVVSELSASLRAKDLSKNDYLKSRAVAFFLKYTNLVNDPKEQCTLTESPARVLPDLVMRYQSQTIEEMYADLGETQWPMDAFDGIDDEVRDIFYSCLKKPFGKLYPYYIADGYSKEFQDYFESHGQVPITSKNAQDLLYLAMRFRIEWLEKACVKSISSSLTYDNVLLYLEKGSIWNCSSLCTQCVAFLLEHPIPDHMKEKVIALASRFNYGILEMDVATSYPRMGGYLTWKPVHGVEIFTSVDRENLRTIHVYVKDYPTSSLQKLLSSGSQVSPIAMHLHDTAGYPLRDPVQHNQTFLQLIQYHSVVSFSMFHSCILSERDLLLQAIERNPHLKALHLNNTLKSHNQDNAAHLSSLMALLTNPQITSLEINATVLERINRDELTRLLEQNSTLKSLSVTCSDDKTHELQPTIYQGLMLNRGLSHLSLRREFFRTWEKPTYFNFDGKNLNPALQANTTLTHLDLSGFAPHRSVCAQEALKACSQHLSLKSVKLGVVEKSDDLVTDIEIFKKENPQIELNYSLTNNEPDALHKRTFAFLRRKADTLLKLGISVGAGLIMRNITGLTTSQILIYPVVAGTITMNTRSLFLRFAQRDDRQLTAKTIERLQQNRRIVTLSEYSFWLLSSNLVGCISTIAALSLFNNLPALRALTAMAGVISIADSLTLTDTRIFSNKFKNWALA